MPITTNPFCKPYGGICDIRWPTSMSLSYWQTEAWKWMPVVFGVGCKSTRLN
jgi:hypothetical protein